MKQRILAPVAVLAALLLAALAPQALAEPPSPAERAIPFGPGERFVYDINWTFITAGQAVLEVLEDTEIDGRPARHIHASARTTSFVDAFYPVRDEMDSYIDMDVTRALQYDKDQNEGDYHATVNLDFDWDRMIVYRYKRGELKNALVLEEPVAFDPLSILFAFRTHPLAEGYEFTSWVTDGKKAVMAYARVIDRETIETDAGEFDCFVVEPDIREVGGVFQKSPGARILVWITADARRIPVRVRSKVVVGHFTLDLTEYTPPRQGWAGD